MNRRWLAWALVPALSTAPLAWQGEAGPPKKKPDFPKFEDVAKNYKKVVSTADGAPSLYTIWTRTKDGQMLAELPRGYASQKHYIALTSPTGEMFAGLQRGEYYVYWKRFDKRHRADRAADRGGALDGRSASPRTPLKTVYNLDRVVVDVPIVCMGPERPTRDRPGQRSSSATPRKFYSSFASGSINRSLVNVHDQGQGVPRRTSRSRSRAPASRW